MNFEDFTLDNGALRDLNELMFTTVFKDPDLDTLFTMVTKAENGKKLGWLDSMGEVGVAGGGCNPEYTGIDITGIEKEWLLNKWRIAKSICYDELEDTLARYGMNTGTERADLTNTPYWDKVLIPLLQKAITEMFWRLVWFGDRDAKHVADGGVITDTFDIALITPVNGLWKALLNIIATNEKQQTVIAANSETTYLDQKKALRGQGVAINIVDTLLDDADSRIFDQPDHAIYMTNSLYKALRNDVVDRYGKTTMPFEHVSAGYGLSEYDGHKIIVLDIWDRLIRKYEDDGTSINCPHRAILASPKNLFVGTSSDDKMSSLTVKFDDRKRDNFLFTENDLGTLVGEDNLVQIAI